MLQEIQVFKENNADGIVFGMLNADGSIDKHRVMLAVQAAATLPVTFHRAFGTYIYMCVCIYICVCIYMRVCMYIYVCIYMHVLIYLFVCAYV